MKKLNVSALSALFLLSTNINTWSAETKEHLSSPLVRHLQEEFRSKMERTYGRGNNSLGMELGLTSIMVNNQALKWLDEPEEWATHFLDNQTDESILQGTVTLGEVKKKALSLEDPQNLLNCYFYGKFGINLQNPMIKKEFKKLLGFFSTILPDFVEEIREKVIMENIFGLPNKPTNIIKTYDLLKEKKQNELTTQQLTQIPFCYIDSFITSTERLHELTKEGSIGHEMKPLQELGGVIETALKESPFVQKFGIGKIWHYILYNQEMLLTSDYDRFTDPNVSEGNMTLGQLKTLALCGNYVDLQRLIFAYKNQYFKLPQDSFVAQEATEWLALFTEAFQNKSTAPQFFKLYTQALIENWFGKISKYSYGTVELSTLNYEAKNGNLAARGLLSLPPFSNQHELLQNQPRKDKSNFNRKKNDSIEECIVS